MTLGAILLIAFHGVAAATLSFAWFRGGRAERAGVVIILAMFVFTWATKVIPARFATVDEPQLVEDLAAFAAFTWLGLRARRFWPLCAAALQLLSLGAHFARGLKSNVDPMVYALMKSMPTLLVCVAIALGAAFYRRRRARASRPGSTGLGIPASWRRHSPG